MNFNEKREFFTNLLANPAHVQKLHSTELEILIQEYPYSNILHAFLASSHSKTLNQEFESKLHLASAYATDRNILFKLINKPELLLHPAQKTAATPIVVHDEEKQDLSDDYPETIEEANALVEELEKAAEETVPEPEQEYNADLPEQTIIDDAPATEDEIYDEIVAIEDIQINPVASAQPLHESEPIAEKDELDLATEKLILGASIASDYLAFSSRQENKIGEIETDEVSVEQQQENTLVSFKNPTNEQQKRVSRYHDEKMPYSFTWWLDKTRREYAGTYQPYVNYAPSRHQDITQKKGADELQHQYIENIFHLNTIEDLEQQTATQTIEFDMHRREDQIIERFIKEEPQIKPPSGDKLDTENKAKKSSEDSDELVTETLARIYVDQMLYHKAADTYKKLALKFPEKSRYFASQIELLERKLN